MVSHLFSTPLSQLCSEWSGERINVRRGGDVGVEVPEVLRGNLFPKTDRATRVSQLHSHQSRYTVQLSPQHGI